jgi:hypothetical protein
MALITTRPAYGSPVSQGYNPQALDLLFAETVKIEYEDAPKVGEQFWAKSTEDSKGDYFTKSFRTGLQGNMAIAEAEGTDIDSKPPYLKFNTTPMVVAGYRKFHAAYGWNEELVTYDERNNDTVDVSADLAGVALYTEELLRHEPLVNGRTFVSGWDKRADGTGIPLYATDHPIISDRTVLTNNIIDSVAGASYATIRAIEEYGQNFRNQEGRPAVIRPEVIITGPAMARELAMLYGTTTDVRQSNAGVPSPVADATTPTIISTIHLDNPNDIHVRYTGWRSNFFELDKYRGQTHTWTEDNPEYTFNRVRTRTLYYYIDPRVAVLIPGVSV